MWLMCARVRVWARLPSRRDRRRRAPRGTRPRAVPDSGRGAGGGMSGALFADTTTAPGLLVTVDGPNGSGKSTLIDAVLGQLDAKPPVHRTRQPSPTPLGQLIRAGEQEYRGRALACLIAGDR